MIFLKSLSSKTDQGTSVPLVSVLNKRLRSSHGDVKIGLWKLPQFVAGSEHLLPSKHSSDLFHMLQRSCIFFPWSAWRCSEL